MLGSKTITFGPKSGSDAAPVAIDPPVLAPSTSATRNRARRKVVDGTRNMNPPRPLAARSQRPERDVVASRNLSLGGDPCSEARKGDSLSKPARLFLSSFRLLRSSPVVRRRHSSAHALDLRGARQRRRGAATARA